MIGGAVEDVVLDGPLAIVPTGGTLPGEVLLTGPEVVGQHPSGIQVASKWHPNGIQMASKWHPSGIQVASKWHPSGIQVASKWHPSVRAHAEDDAEAARELGMVVACIEVAAIPGLAVEVEG